METCPACGLGWALHDSNGNCPEDHDKYRCPYCGAQGKYIGYTPTGPDSWEEAWRCLGDCGEAYTVYGHNDNWEEDRPLLELDGLTARRLGRVRKALQREYRFAEGVMTLRDWLETQDLTHKSHRVRKYARKKRQGCYKELKAPVTEYTVWTGDTGIQIPKIVWDVLNIPEKEN